SASGQAPRRSRRDSRRGSRRSGGGSGRCAPSADRDIRAPAAARSGDGVPGSRAPRARRGSRAGAGAGAAGARVTQCFTARRGGAVADVSARTRSYTSAQTSIAAARVLPSRRAGIAETNPGEESRGSHQGSQAGADRQARGERDGHRLDRGPGRDAHPEDQRAHRAPPDAPEGPLLEARSSVAGRAPPPVPRLPAAQGPRGLPGPHQGARPPPVARSRAKTEKEGGRLIERRAAGAAALAQTSSFRRSGRVEGKNTV